MEIRTLQYFLEVAEKKNITKAAESLHITQPTLSRQIQDLEDELGCQLFLRTTRHLELTEEGMLFRRRAQEITELANISTEELSKFSNQLEGTIRIGVGDFNAIKKLSSQIKKMQEKYPKITFQLTTTIAHDVEEGLSRGLLDFGMISTFANQDLYVSIPYYKEEWIAMVSQNNPLASNTQICPKDLLKEPLILPFGAKTSQSRIAQWFGYDFNQTNVIVESNLTATSAMLVSNNVGCAIVMEGSAKYWNESIVTKPLDPPIVSDISLIYRKGKTLSPVANIFLKEFIQ